MASDYVDELKSISSKLSNYNHDPEPVEELKRLNELTKTMKDSPQSLPIEQANCVVSFLPSLVGSLLNNRKYLSREAIQLAGDILSNIMLLLPQYFSNSKYLEALRMTAEADRAFYQTYMQDERAISWAIPPEPVTDTLAEWREELKEGDFVDAVKVDTGYDRKCWSTAKITSVDSDDYLTIEFQDEGTEFDRFLPKTSQEIAPLDTKCKDKEWRTNLDKDMMIDAYDTASTWYNSTILGKRFKQNDHGTMTAELLVGYRVYESSGEKFDENGNFRGWSSKYDEWISIWSPRLAPFNTHARKWPIPLVTVMEENIIDDSNDLIEDAPYAFFVTRHKKSKSMMLIRNLNRLQLAEIFDLIVNIINNREQWAHFDTVYSLTYLVGKIYALYHKAFVTSYVNKFKDALFGYLLSCPQNIIRDFNKEKLDQMLGLMESFLKRFYTIQEKNAIIEQFTLDLSLICFETPYLERRIQGLKGIIDAVNKSKYTQTRSVKIESLVKWLKDHDVINEIFGIKGHYQLVQRAAEILRLFANENEITVAELEEVWNASQKNDEDMKHSVYKILADVSTNLKSEHLELLVDKIAEMPPNKLFKEEVDLLHELTKYPLRAGSATNRACELLWSISLDEEKYSDPVKDLALENFCSLMKSWDLRKNRIPVMIQCVEKIRENKAVIQSIQIIKKLLANFFVYSTPTEPTSRGTIVDMLIKEHEILVAFFDNLYYFKEKAAQWGKGEDIKNVVISDRTIYKDQIEQRLSFLHTLLTSSISITLTQKQMDTLWDLLLQNSYCSAERECFLKWLGDVTESQSQGKKIFDDSDVHSFFLEKVANLKNSYFDMSPEGFTVFKSYFLLINASLSNMKQNPKTSYSSNTTTTSTYINPSYQNEYAIKEFDYQIITAPLSLVGMECLRKIIMEVKNEKVLSQASDFLNDLYDNLNTSENLIEIREEFVGFCLGYLKQGSVTEKKRALSLMKSFMEECEKKGTAGLKSHSALLKGDIHNLVILNQVSYYPQSADIPRRIELKVYSNTTFWELRCIIGKKIKCMSDQFKIYRSLLQKEIKDSDNGKTLSDLRIRVNETFSVYRRITNIPKASLTTSENQLSEKARKIFSQWFHKYADKGDKMSPEGCSAFTNSCTGDPCKATDKRIQEFFTSHDDDRDGLLTEENFLEFYRQACIQRPNVVWTNLASHHYRNDLKCYDDEEEDFIDPKALPGFILTQKQENFDLIFSALNEENLANDAWDLIIKLPTNPQIFEKIKNLEGYENWESLLDSSSNHKLLYALQIIESFMEDPPEDDLAAFDERCQWKVKFLQKGGFGHLYSILLKYQANLDIFQKSCIGFVLKLICVFIIAAFSAVKPDIYEVVKLVRKQSGGLELEEKPSTPTEPEEKKSDKKVNFGEEGTQTDELSGYASLLQESLPVEPQKVVEEDTSMMKYQETRGFKDLVNEVMMNDLGDSLINSVDLSLLMSKLIGLMVNTLKNEDYEPEDKHIIDSALELWVSCLMHKNELIQSVYDYQGEMDVSEFTIRGLTFAKMALVRKAFCQSFKSICIKVSYPEKMPTPFFLDILINRMPTGIVDPKEADHTQFFELLCELVELDVAQPSIDYEQLALHLMNTIKQHPYTEKRNTFASDKVLVGYLSLAERVFKFIPELKNMAYEKNFTRDCFFELLFPPEQIFDTLKYDPEYVQETGHFQPPKAKARDTRNAAYKLINALVHDHSENLMSIIEVLESLRTQITPVKSWTYSPASDVRSSHGYAGIVNLGCICYMISMLQQFYMIPQFRYSILDVDDKKEPTNLAYLKGDPNVDKSKPGVELDDNMLHQLQSMFAFLDLTDRNAYNPHPWCQAFKDSSGQPVNISIQQDAQEFLNRIFEKLESALKNTQSKYLTQGIFGGKNSVQLICKECGKVKESLEDYYNLSVDVKHSKTLFASLNKYIQGETISDYYCETCDKKVDITKRSLLADLPNILIVHLQRIVFNFDTFENEKINSRLEFPTELNLFPYTKVGVKEQEEKEKVEKEEKEKEAHKEQETTEQVSEIDQEEYKYDLVGIVLHLGTAQMGHYYSFIRHRLPNGEADPQKWYEFNDSTVRVFNPDNIESECFGGAQDFGGDDFSATWLKSFKENSKNAYMLVYEKKRKHPLKILKAPVLEGDSTTSPRSEEEFELRNFNDLRRTMPSNIYQSVLKDNERYMFERNLYSAEFFNFFVEIIKSAEASFTDLSAIGADFALEVMSHAYHNRSLPDLVKVIKDLFSEFPESCEKWILKLLDNSMYSVTQLLLTCIEKTTRSALADLFSFSLNLLAKRDFSDNSIAKIFIDGLLNLIPQDISKHWTRFQQFWEVIKDFAADSPEHALYLIHKGVIGTFLDFYLGNKSPLLKPGENRQALGNKLWTPNFDPLIQIIAILDKYCATNVTDGQYKLTYEEKSCLLDKEMYDKTLRNSYDGKALSEIVSHWSYEDKEYSQMIAQIILKGLNEIDYEDVKGFYEVLEEFLTIKDSLTKHRIEWIMGFPTLVKINRADLMYPFFGSSIITAIDDEIITYSTTLCFGYTIYDAAESVLSLIWKHRRRWDHYCIMSIKHLLGICLKNPELANYINNLPPATYQYKHYIDWIEEYIANYKNYSSAYASYGSSSYSTKKEDHSIDASKYLQEFKEKYPSENKEMFILGRTTKKEIASQSEQEDVLLTVTEYTTQWGRSEPDGKRNLALPTKPLRSELNIKASYSSSRPAGINVDSQGYSYSNTNAQSYSAYPYSNFNYPSTDERVTYGPAPPGKSSGSQSNAYLQQKYADEECEEETTDEAVPPLPSPGGSFNTPAEDYPKVHITTQEEPKEEHKEEEEDHDKLFFEAQTIMRFEVYNRSSDPVRVNLQIYSNDENPNYLYPSTPIVIELSAHTFKDLIILTKKNPGLQWGDLKYDFSTSEPKPFALKSEPSEDYKESGAISYYPNDDVAVNISDVGSENEDTKAPTGKIACPLCTFHNDSGALKCEICGSIFRSKG